MLNAFCEWLAKTPPSLLVQNVLWIIPFFQALHILAIGVLASSIALVDVRLMGFGKSRTVAAMDARFMPWIWAAFWVLLATGVVLILGEPKRELLNWIFRTKVLLVAVLIAVAAMVHARARSNATYFEAEGGVLVGRAIGGFSLAMLLAIITCGRWIAYAGMES